MGRACGENPNTVKEITEWAVQNTHLPVIIKITPNYGEAEALAESALEGGAKAVTLTNTMPGLQDPLPSGKPIVGVGTERLFAPGGTTGPVLRPFAMKKCADTAKLVPKIQIFASGGIISGDHAMAYL